MHPDTQQARDTYRTFGRSQAVRLPDYDYANDAPIHLTLCLQATIESPDIRRLICDNVEYYCRKFAYVLYGYCLMPDHLHVLLSPGKSGIPLSKWLNSYKSFTTHAFGRMGHRMALWQLSAHDHVCRKEETAVNVVMYIANNPVRAGLVENWDDWKWTKIFVEV